MQGQNADFQKYDTKTKVAFQISLYSLCISIYSSSEFSNLSFGGR